MEALSADTLTVLILISIILSGVAFIAVSFLIIFLLCTMSRRSTAVTPVGTHSITPTGSYVSRTDSIISASTTSSSSSSSSASSISIRKPVDSPPKKQQPQKPLPIQKDRSESISTVEDHRPEQGKKYQVVYINQNNNQETRVEAERQMYNQRRKHTTNVRFNDRQTPYPPDVLARDRFMMTHIRGPIDNQRHQ